MHKICLKNRNDLSYSTCIDSFAMCCTTYLEVSPVYLSITEAQIRSKYRFVVLRGVWAGKKKLRVFVKSGSTTERNSSLTVGATYVVIDR